MHWAASGQDQVYEPGLEIAHGASFLGAVTLATGIITMTVWQLIDWITQGWSWYFSSTVFLTTWPGWLNAFAFAVFATFIIYALFQLPILGIPTAIAGGIGLIMSVLASPVVRVHGWVTSWGASWTIIISALILTALLYWTGVYFGDRLNAEQPVQLKKFARGRLPSTVSRRTRWYPDHEVGHSSCISFDLHEARLLMVEDAQRFTNHGAGFRQTQRDHLRLSQRPDQRKAYLAGPPQTKHRYMACRPRRLRPSQVVISCPSTGLAKERFKDPQAGPPASHAAAE
jgi:hypothetical protein